MTSHLITITAALESDGWAKAVTGHWSQPGLPDYMPDRCYYLPSNSRGFSLAYDMADMIAEDLKRYEVKSATDCATMRQWQESYDLKSQQTEKEIWRSKQLIQALQRQGHHAKHFNGCSMCGVLREVGAT